MHLVGFTIEIYYYITDAGRYKAWVCGRSPAKIVVSNPTGGHGRLSVVSVVRFQVEVSATS